MSKAKIVFTDKMIKSLKPAASDYAKSEGNGFTIRVMPTGVKTWLYLYAINGIRRKMNLGQYPAVTLETARNKFEDARRQVKNGIDPVAVAEQQREKEQAEQTVSELFADYIARDAKLTKRESSWKENERLFNLNVAPFWGKRKIGDITKRDCIALLDKYAHQPALCNHVMKLTRRMFNFAMEKDLMQHTPFASVKVPVSVAVRERMLSQAEIAKFWNTELPKASMSDEVKRILKLCLLTAQRVGEVAGITEAEIDGNWWNLPAERSKNKRAHRIYLTETALEVLGKPVNGLYFPSPKLHIDDRGNITYTSIQDNAVSYAIRKNLKDYQPRRPISGDKVKMVKVAEDRKMDMAHFTPHDLRRTANTLMAACKVPKEYRERVLNHTLEKLDGTYNLYDYDDEKKLALEALEKRLLAILSR